MQDHATEQELRDRLSLIESMIAEGRRTSESWGWAFVLWGLAYYAAIAWSLWRPSAWAWPVCVTAACLLMWAKSVWNPRLRTSASQPETTIGRAILAIWITMGISMFVLLFSLGLSGRTDWHVFVAVACTLLGTANAASSLILRWRVQFGCALAWWAAAVAACFGSDTLSMTAFLIAIFLCQIVFGVYGMILEARERKLHA